MPGSTCLQETVDIQVTDVVRAADGAVVVRGALVVATGVIMALVNASQAGDARATKVDDIGGTHVEDVRGCPAAVVELMQVVCGLVVASDCSTASSDCLRL